MKTFAFEELDRADLYVDALYEGGAKGNTSDDPLCKLLPGIGNMGGFRVAGRGESKSFVVLYSSGEDIDWPDSIDIFSGRFVYFGDNKTPGHDLHDTKPGGNLILRKVFENLHAAQPQRELIPPFFVFIKHPTANSCRSVQFKGIAAPGFPEVSPTDDLIALWKTTGGQRFQNYRALFTILDVPSVSRDWIASLSSGTPSSVSIPKAWSEWLAKGRYRPLKAEPTTNIRTKEAQIPDTDLKKALLGLVYRYFKEAPFLFEAFAARIFRMQDERIIIDEITRGVVDGGRDAIGRYQLGLADDPVYAEFALEAKCYAPPIDGNNPSTVGVKEVSRLISRLRHLQFGVLVTTSVVAEQAYKEVREDRHPIIFISGKDIADTLIEKGYNKKDLLQTFLEIEFPLGSHREGR